MSLTDWRKKFIKNAAYRYYPR